MVRGIRQMRECGIVITPKNEGLSIRNLLTNCPAPCKKHRELTVCILSALYTTYLSLYSDYSHKIERTKSYLARARSGGPHPWMIHEQEKPILVEQQEGINGKVLPSPLGGYVKALETLKCQLKQGEITWLDKLTEIKQAKAVLDPRLRKLHRELATENISLMEKDRRKLRTQFVTEAQVWLQRMTKLSREAIFRTTAGLLKASGHESGSIEQIHGRIKKDFYDKKKSQGERDLDKLDQLLDMWTKEFDSPIPFSDTLIQRFVLYELLAAIHALIFLEWIPEQYITA